jgi:hypothetical protein
VLVADTLQTEDVAKNGVGPSTSSERTPSQPMA